MKRFRQSAFSIGFLSIVVALIFVATPSYILANNPQLEAKDSKVIELLDKDVETCGDPQNSTSVGAGLNESEDQDTQMTSDIPSVVIESEDLQPVQDMSNSKEDGAQTPADVQSADATDHGLDETSIALSAAEDDLQNQNPLYLTQPPKYDKNRTIQRDGSLFDNNKVPYFELYVRYKDMDDWEANEIKYYEHIESICVNGEYVYKKTTNENVANNQFAINSAGVYGTTIKIAENQGFKYYKNHVVVKASGWYEDNSFIVINKKKEGVVPPKPIDPPKPEKQDYEFNDSVLNNISQATSWQIINGEYKPGNQELLFSDDKNLLIKRSVIPTDTENNFIMLFELEPRVTWKNIFALNKIVVSTSNKKVKPGGYPTGGKISDFRPERTGSYQNPVNFVYMNGKEKLAEVVMYHSSNKVPNGSIGIGNKILRPDGKSIFAQNRFDTGSNGHGMPEVKINIGPYLNKRSLFIHPTYPKEVRLRLADYMSLQGDGDFNFEGKTCSSNDGKNIVWKMDPCDLSIMDYEVDSNGNLITDDITTCTVGGNKYYYRKGALRLSYKFKLDTTQSGFKSADNAYKEYDWSKPYSYPTLLRSTVRYTVGDSGSAKTMQVAPTYVKGLLYDLRFNKVLAGSKIPLEGATFSLGTNDYDYLIKKTSDSNGAIEFNNLSTGSFRLAEIKANNELIGEKIPGTPQTLEVGYVRNPHVLKFRPGQHPQYLLSDGYVENKPFEAGVSITKVVQGPDGLEAADREKKFDINLSSQDVFAKPKKDDVELTEINSRMYLKHGETESLKVILPKSGGKLQIEEVLSEEDSQIYSIDKIECAGHVLEMNDGRCTLDILPGDELDIVIYNSVKPRIGTVRIENSINNFKPGMADDLFRTYLDLDGQEGPVNCVCALKAQEKSGYFEYEKAQTFYITTVVPKDYRLVDMQAIDADTSEVIPIDNKKTEPVFHGLPGQNIELKITYEYLYKPYFHSSQSISSYFVEG